VVLAYSQQERTRSLPLQTSIHASKSSFVP
jgi:hypothetical protein